MKMLIADKELEIIDILSNITIVKTSVCKKHKVGTDSHGERKIYLPGSIDEKYRFFDNFPEDIKGIVWKDNLIEYLQKAKSEYYNPSKNYNGKEEMKEEHGLLLEKIERMDALLSFKVKRAEVGHTGLYINQNSGRRRDANWNLITDIALPELSRVSIIKGKMNEELVFYFKLSYGTLDIEKTDDKEIQEIEKIKNSRKSETEKETIIMARIGQGKYRKNLLRETSMCPFTLIDDEHLLIASHIKPWKDSTAKEKKDSKNGLILSPTFDKLFDKGYISFEDDKSLIISPWLSKYNRERLNLEKGMIIDKLPEFDESRKRYLAYHREFILKKLEEL